MSRSSASSKIRLSTSDSQVVEVERDVAERSMLIKNLLTDIPYDESSEAIPIPNVSPRPRPTPPRQKL
jgi:S-phase kinase-associated protein 1